MPGMVGHLWGNGSEGNEFQQRLFASPMTMRSSSGWRVRVFSTSKETCGPPIMVTMPGLWALASRMMAMASGKFMVTEVAPTASGWKASRAALSFSGVYRLTI
jgi:hypothetical protein